MPTDEREPDVTRRDLGALLGILGGAAGLAALGGCATPASGGVEPVATSRAAYSPGNLAWFQSIVNSPWANSDSTYVLTQNAGTFDFQVAVVTNYYSYNPSGASTVDGGGGLFYWDAHSTATPDGGTIFAVTASDGGILAGRWLRIYSGPLNVKWFGAVGDGVANDGPTIQNVLNIFSGSTNTTRANAILFPPGIYSVEQTLTFDGPGVGGAIQLMAAPGPQSLTGVRLLWTGASGGTLARFAGLSNARFDGLAFDGGNKAAVALLIDSDQATGGAPTFGVTLSDCMFTGAVGSGSALVQIGTTRGDEVSDIMFKNCTFGGAGYGTTGTYTQYGVYEPGGANTCQFTFEDCNFSNMQYGAYLIGGGGAVAFNRGGFGSISNVFVYNGVQPLSFYQCSCQNAAGGIWFRGSGVVSIRDCCIINNIANVPNYIMFDQLYGSLLIENCLIDGTGESGGTNPTAVRMNGTAVGGLGNAAGGFTSINNTWAYNNTLLMYNTPAQAVVGAEPNDVNTFAGWSVTSIGDRGGNPGTGQHIFPTILGGVALMWGTADPSTFGSGTNQYAATWNQGAVMYNRQPVPGGPIGWVCTTGGSPGTWKAFGTIST